MHVTVVVPVLDGMDLLPRSVAALQASSLPRADWELVVVDDGSTDGTGDWARARGYRVIPVPGGPRGPGPARNLGAAEARGRILVFVDADVCVHSGVLARFLAIFQDDPELGAAFGTYDDHPDDPGFLSQYRNLYHRYVHQRGAGDTETFWAGCGAVRRDVFHAVGGFDEVRFPRPQIEDIELGYRIRDAGHRILLDPGIECGHLKRWTVRGVVRTDLFDRGIPWMRLLLERPRPPSLNIGISERIRTALVGLALGMLLVAAVTGSARWLGFAVAAVALHVLSNLRLYRWLADRRGWRFAAAAVPLNLLYYMISGLAVVIAVVQHLGVIRLGRRYVATPYPRGKTMSCAASTSEPESKDDDLTLAFAPLHKRALGTAVGIIFGAALFLITAVGILRGDPPNALFGLRHVLPLYDVTWSGAVLGSLSASLAAFCAGWFLAFGRNMIIGLGIWSVRTRAELAQTRDFLDHI